MLRLGALMKNRQRWISWIEVLRSEFLVDFCTDLRISRCSHLFDQRHFITVWISHTVDTAQQEVKGG